jgi:hypothetical protein
MTDATRPKNPWRDVAIIAAGLACIAAIAELPDLIERQGASPAQPILAAISGAVFTAFGIVLIGSSVRFLSQGRRGWAAAAFISGLFIADLGSFALEIAPL